jgi:phage terminase large subunit-like protein
MSSSEVDVGLAKAERVKRFIETHCTYSKGEWAGQPFRLLDWQWNDLVKPLFGTLNGGGNRKYRVCYCEIPKKNGKTELCAALALYMLTSDYEEGPEVYVAAADREQAGLTYQAAAAMVRSSATMSKNLKCLDSRKRIIFSGKNGFLQVLSSESYTKHGLSPSCVIVDEIHAHPDDDLWNVLTAGTDYARKQQVVLVITTAGVYDKNSIWWKLRSKALQVKSGIVEDPRFLPVLYLADPEKYDASDEELWKRVNPSLGQIFTLDKIRQDYGEAKNDPVDFQNFLRFRLNIPVKSLSRWMPMDKWDTCAGVPDLEALKGRSCYGGLDLSSTLDLTGFVLVFPPEKEDGFWDVLVKAYCPEEGIIKRSKVDRVRYDIWEKQGFLTATPGEVVDYDWVKRDVYQAAKDYSLNEIGYDPWNATQVTNDIMAELNPSAGEYGFQRVDLKQIVKTYAEAMKDMLKAIVNGKVRHGGHPVLRWCADNLVVKIDANGNPYPNKERATEKIDLMTATFMAWNRAMNRADVTSAYEHRGVLVF